MNFKLTCLKGPVEAVKSTFSSHKQSYDYDLIVIGGGPGGNALAKEAARLGAKTLIVDQCTPSKKGHRWTSIGGSCIHNGAMPMKIANHIIDVGFFLQDAMHYGWQLPTKDIKYDWSTLIRLVEQYTNTVSIRMERELERLQIDYLTRFGVLDGPHLVRIEPGSFHRKRTFTGKYIAIATGSRPSYIKIPGVEHCITTDDLFGLEVFPSKVLIIGGGTVGIVCACMFRSFGSEITVLSRSQLLKSLDSQMADIIVEFMVKRGVKFIKNVTIKLVHKLPNNVLRVFWYDKHKSVCFDLFNVVVLAVGRDPAIADLNLDKVGVKLCKHKVHIKTVNDQTNISHIYAIGDVQCRKEGLCACATKVGLFLARRLFGKSNISISLDDDNVPQFLHTFPEYGWVGLSEEEAIEMYGSDGIEVYHSYYEPIVHLVPNKHLDMCYLKVITMRKGQQKVLGMHIIGPNAGETIQGFAAAMSTNYLTMNVLNKTVGIWSTTAAQFPMVHVTKRSAHYPYAQEGLG